MCLKHDNRLPSPHTYTYIQVHSIVVSFFAWLETSFGLFFLWLACISWSAFALERSTNLSLRFLFFFFPSLLLLFLFSLFFSRSQQQQLPFLLLLLLLPAGTLVCPLSRGLANLIIICFALIIIMIIVAAALVCQIVCKGCCSFRKKKEKNTKKKTLATKSRVCIVYVSHMFAFIAKSWHMAWPWSWKHTYASVYTGIDICIACIYMYMCQFHLYTCLYGERGGERHAERVQNISEGLANCYCNTGCQ